MQWFSYALLAYGIGQVASVLLVLRCGAMWRCEGAGAVRPHRSSETLPSTGANRSMCGTHRLSAPTVGARRRLGAGLASRHRAA